jgi:hypothetical protein
MEIFQNAHHAHFSFIGQDNHLIDGPGWVIGAQTFCEYFVDDDQTPVFAGVAGEVPSQHKMQTHVCYKVFINGHQARVDGI